MDNERAKSVKEHFCVRTETRPNCLQYSCVLLQFISHDALLQIENCRSHFDPNSLQCVFVCLCVFVFWFVCVCVCACAFSVRTAFKRSHHITHLTHAGRFRHVIAPQYLLKGDKRDTTTTPFIPLGMQTPAVRPTDETVTG